MHPPPPASSDPPPADAPRVRPPGRPRSGLAAVWGGGERRRAAVVVVATVAVWNLLGVPRYVAAVADPLPGPDAVRNSIITILLDQNS